MSREKWRRQLYASRSTVSEDDTSRDQTQAEFSFGKRGLWYLPRIHAKISFRQISPRWCTTQTNESLAPRIGRRQSGVVPVHVLINMTYPSLREFASSQSDEVGK